MVDLLSVAKSLVPKVPTKAFTLDQFDRKLFN